MIKSILAEELAYHFLKKNGFKVLLRNYECMLGEIDLIAQQGQDLVFISVNRTDEKHLANVKRVAAYYVNRYGIKDVQTRFDNVTVEIKADNEEPFITVLTGESGVMNVQPKNFQLIEDMIEALDEVVREHGLAIPAAQVKKALKRFEKQWTLENLRTL